MFSKIYTRWIAGALLTMGLVVNLMGTGAASAQTLTATSTAQLTIAGGSAIAAGSVVTVQGTGYKADESISLWINVPSGTTVSNNSLGQTNTYVDGSVIPVDNMPSADDYGTFTYSLNTTGLPAGNYSLVAHGVSSYLDQVADFTITAAASTQAPAAASSSTIASGTMFAVQGTGYNADEDVSFWINVPDGTTVSANSLGQTDSTIDGTVIPVDSMASADDNGAFSFSLNTSGLPNGNYSLVAHGLTSKIEQVFTFTIDGAVSAQAPLTAEGNTTVAAGTMLAIKGTSYQADEPVGLWINVPDGTTISNNSLGQTDTTIDGTVIPLDAMASADDYGAFTYTLDTTGLPAGNYSIVAHGLNSKIDNVLNFTIQ